MRATALVVDANAPAKGGRWGGNPGTVRILVDAGSGPVLASRTFKLNEDRWLVPGMDVEVTVDPGEPDGFEVDWDSIPAIEARAAANDPALADPAAAEERVAAALRSAGAAGVDTSPREPDRFAESLERAAAEPAPPGRVRAVARIATIQGHVDMKRQSRTLVEGKCKAVLSVSVPGQAPYAVYDKRLKVPSGQWDVTGAGLPALVSSSDPNDVEVLWDELPSLGSQIGQRISDSVQAAQADLGAAPITPFMPGAAGMSGMGGGVQEMMARNAQAAIDGIADPNQRRMLIDQYRAAGIQVHDPDERPEA